MEDDCNDCALVRAFRAGEPEAFTALFERFSELLSHRIRDRLSPRVRRRVSVADVLQETQLAAHQSLPDIEAEDMEGLKGWLLAVAEHKALDLQRRHDGAQRRSVRREVTRTGRAATDAHAGRQPSPSEVAMVRETAELARRAREALSSEYREVLRLAREEALPLAEVAERMGRSYEATKKLYGRAFCRFKAIFDSLQRSAHG